MNNKLEIRNSSVFGDEFLWPKKDIHCWEYFNRTGTSNDPATFPNEVLQYVTGRSSVIQAGGNSGLYANLYSKHFDRVYSFEPDHDWFECLVHNAPANNVFKFQCCIGNDTRGLSVSPPPDAWGGVENLGAMRVTGEGNIPQLKIDSLGLSPDLIHLDIEGFEQSAIEGAIETIKRSKPVIVIEMNSFLSEFYGYSEDAIFKLISPFGYRKVKEWIEDNQNIGTKYQTSDILYSV
jgi:FkbM family methyltransferase